MIGVAMQVHEDPETLDTLLLQTETTQLEENEPDLQSEQGIWGTIKSSASRQVEAHLVNPIIYGLKILTILLKGLNPFSFSADMYTNTLEKLIAYILIFIRALIMAIAMIEAYMLYINKKTN